MEAQLLKLHSLVNNETNSKEACDLATMYTLLGYIMNQIDALGGLKLIKLPVKMDS